MRRRGAAVKGRRAWDGLGEAPCGGAAFAANGAMQASDTNDQPPAAREPRPAASLLVMRDGPDGPELLMGRRSAGHRFMPGVLVFPGGAVDAADHHARVATPLAPRVRARLERSATPGLAQALAVAAARELTEEVGMSLGDPPALDGLDYLCRAITPPERAMRFDARFFIVAAGRVSGAPTASRELEAPGWFSVEAALASEIALATRAVLGQLRRWLTHHDRDGPVPVLRDRAWFSE
jgi:8-oxo-dGTP pyrophosphatase MutT (NUDIX family)